VLAKPQQECLSEFSHLGGDAVWIGGFRLSEPLIENQPVDHIFGRGVRQIERPGAESLFSSLA
jgi:hypothetical protein